MNKKVEEVIENEKTAGSITGSRYGGCHLWQPVRDRIITVQHRRQVTLRGHLVTKVQSKGSSEAASSGDVENIVFTFLTTKTAPDGIPDGGR